MANPSFWSDWIADQQNTTTVPKNPVPTSFGQRFGFPDANTEPDVDISRTGGDPYQVLKTLTQMQMGPADAMPPISGPQQSYAQASNLQGSGDGTSGQAGQMQSSYNNSPYTPGPQGTFGNTGAPQAQGQGELAGQGARGWNIYQTTPTWTGSPLSQSPEARDEGDFKAPPVSGPQNPLLQRQAMLRQQILQQAMQNIPHGYQFKLAGDVLGMPGAATPGDRASNALKNDELNKITTRQILMRALGGGAQVLPISRG